MGKKRLLVVFLALALIFCFPASAYADPGSNNGLALGNQEEGQILIKFTQNSGKGQVPELSDADEIGSIPQLGVKIMKVKNPKAIAKLVANNKHVEYVEENTMKEIAAAPTDPGYRSTGYYYAGFVNAEQGWDQATTTNVPVAILDTGINPHPDLPNPVHVWNIVSRNSNVTDLHGHGSRVAGTLAGKANNGIGGAGVIWEYNNLTFIKISELSTGSAYTSDIANAIIYAVDRGCKIISLSYGGPSGGITERNAVEYAYNKGAIVFAASGNESTSASLTATCYPAAFDKAMGVGALGSATARSSYSNGGSGLDIMASGSWYSTTQSNGYTTWSGTSCATPVAAGIAALIWGVCPGFTNEQLMSFMKENARDINTPGWDSQTGWGVADMNKLLSLAVYYRDNGLFPPILDTTPPVITLSGSANMTLNREDPYIEPGYKAVDNVDGDITHKVKVTGTVDTNVVGRYTLTYEVADEAGNVAKATRTVNVVKRSVSFSFSNSGKAGASFNNSFSLKFPGDATVSTPSLDNKSSLTVTIRDAQGAAVFTNTFTSNASKTVNLAAGNYTVVTKIETGNGNTGANVSISVTEGEAPPPPAPTAPSISLTGSANIVLHLGGSAYYEQGAKASDSKDGDISSQVVIDSNVDTTKAGNYTVKYTVTNTAGLSSSVTRNVEVLAPLTRNAPGKTFSFAPKGKQGENFTYSADVAVAGSVAFTASVPNKTSVTVTIADAAGNEVLKEKFAANATRNFQAAQGNYTVKMSMDETNGNSTVNLSLVTPGGTETYFSKPEVPR